LLYSSTLQPPTVEGWKEVRGRNNSTSYKVCDRQISSDVSNWLWTPFIERGEASSIVIEIDHAMKSCHDYNDNDGDDLPSCKGTFMLFLYECDSSIMQHQVQSWESKDYTELKEIATLRGRLYDVNHRLRARVNKKGFHVAIRDQGSCLSISSLKVYYETCPAATIDFTHLPEIIINGDKDWIKAKGECVANAIPKYEGGPKRKCERISWKNDGWEWDPWGSDTCHCKAGYQPDPIKNNTCTSCPVGQFKPQPGGDECKQCPPYTKGLAPGLDVCPCIEGYHRSGYDSAYRMCSRPPSSPSNLTLTKVHSTTATLSWSPPLDNGNRSDTRYRVSCDTCGSWVAFNPGTETFQQTSVTIENLYPETSYRFLVFSQNGVSDLVEEEPQYAEIIVVTTESNPVLSKRVYELEHELEDLKHKQEDLENFVKMISDKVQGSDI